MMLDCKYCGGTGKLHDDADAFEQQELEDAHARCREYQKALAVVAMERDDLKAKLSEGSNRAAHWYVEMATALKKAEEERDDLAAKLTVREQTRTAMMQQAEKVCSARPPTASRRLRRG